MESRAFTIGLIVGILATVTMDVVAMMAVRLGIAAILFGTATTVFPWFLMFPSQGMGRGAPGDAHLARISLFNHIIFGLGLALWMAVMRPI